MAVSTYGTQTMRSSCIASKLILCPKELENASRGRRKKVATLVCSRLLTNHQLLTALHILFQEVATVKCKCGQRKTCQRTPCSMENYNLLPRLLEIKVAQMEKVGKVESQIAAAWLFESQLL